MTIAKAALMSVLLLLPGTAFALTGDCHYLHPGAGLEGTDAWGDVLKSMSMIEKLKLSQGCFVDNYGSRTPDTAAECAQSINEEIAARYHDISEKVTTAYNKLGAINLTSPLNCTGPHVPKNSPPVTTEPFALAYWIAPAGAKAQQDTMKKLSSYLKPDASTDRELEGSLPRLALGRGSAADYQRAVDRLACLYPSKFDNAADAHEMLRSVGLGVDCAGSVQIILHDTTGVPDNRDLGLFPSGDEAFLHKDMKQRPWNFKFSSDPLNLRPGDIIPLEATDHGVGHVVTVQNVQFAISQGGNFGEAGDPLLQVKVASSWGGGAGPQLRTWVYDTRTKQWASLGDDGSLTPTPDGPYNHIYSGQYRSVKLPVTSF